MPTNQVRRPRFYEGQFLGAADLTSAIEYARLEDARHMLGGHTWGIAAGLELREQPSPAGGGEVDVFVQPGHAWDGFGRPIVVLSPFKIGAERFASFPFDSANPDGYPMAVWLRYQESATKGAAVGFELCESADQNSRIEESFQLEVGPRPGHPDRHDPISVAGRSVDAQQVLRAFDAAAPELFDESVSYQAFPEAGERSRWLVPLGDVFWKPNANPNLPGTFAALPANALQVSLSRRRYIGVVAGSIESAGGQFAGGQLISGHIRLHDRTRDYSTIQSNDLVWVEGSLRVEGDAKLFNGKLDFRDSQGLDRGIPLMLQRSDPAVGGGSVQAVIGKANAGNNTFAFGPLDNANNFVSKMVVRDDGRVGIGTTTPAASLHVAGAGQVVVREDGKIGIGTTAPAAPLHISGVGNQFLDVSTDDPQQSYTRLMAVSSNGVQESQLQFRGRLGFVGPLGGNFVMTLLESGNVGIGTITPFTKLTMTGPIGFTNAASPMMYVYQSGTANAERPVIAHSPAFPNWGLSYRDVGSKMVFLGSGLPKVTVDLDAGNVGIGTDSPATALHIVSATGAEGAGYGNPMLFGQHIEDAATQMWGLNGVYGRLFTWDSDSLFVGLKNEGGDRKDAVIAWGDNALDSLRFMFTLPGNPGPAPQEFMRITAGGNVGIGTIAPSQRLHVVGAMRVDGLAFKSGFFWDQISDERLKNNIRPLEGSLDRLLQLRGVSFRWREPETSGGPAGPQMGLIAQEVEKVMPEWVTTTESGFKAISPNGLEALLIESLRELKTEIEDIKARLSTLETPPTRKTRQPSTKK